MRESFTSRCQRYVTQLWGTPRQGEGSVIVHRIAVFIGSLLLATMVMTPGVAAQKKELTLDAPVRISQTTVRLAGRVSGDRHVVVVQRRAGGRWVTASRVPVVNGRYQAVVRTSGASQRYRTVVGRLKSPVRTVLAVQAAPAPVAGPNDACGTPRVKVDGTRRACTFADDFNGSQLDRTKWVPQTNFLSGDPAGAYACYRDNPANVLLSGGALQLTLRKEPAPVACAVAGTAPTVFTAGSVMTYRLFSQAYGRFEARIKNTATSKPGLQEAFWLWPDDRQTGLPLWPAAGEIDIVETYSHFPTLAIPFLHYNWNDNLGATPGLNTAWNCSAPRGVWNTYALEWTATKLQIFVNGKSCLVNTSGNVAFQRKFILALTQMLGVGANSYLTSTTVPATMSVDYVRVWE